MHVLGRNLLWYYQGKLHLVVSRKGQVQFIFGSCHIYQLLPVRQFIDNIYHEVGENSYAPLGYDAWDTFT